MKKLILLLLILAGCGHTPSKEYKDILNIDAELCPYESKQFIIVNKTYAIDEQRYDGIDNAVVVLRHGNFADTLFSTAVKGHYLSRDSIPITPADTFCLSVKAPGLDSAYGITIVPDTASILYPKANDTVDISDSIVIKVCKKNYYYLSCIYPDFSGIGFHSNLDTLDTLWIVQLSSLRPYAGTVNCEISISSYDKNYWEYYIDEESTGGITGGIGVFSSMSKTEFPLWIKN